MKQKIKMCIFWRFLKKYEGKKNWKLLKMKVWLFCSYCKLSELSIFMTYSYLYSEFLQMFSSNSLIGNDTWVSGLKLFWFNIGVHMGRNKLSLVVSWSITDNNLGWVFVWHYDSWLWKSASEGIWVIWLKRFFKHTSM